LSPNPHEIVEPVAARPSLWREPLLHFLALGGLVFAAHAAFKGDDRRVQITAATKAQLGRELAEQLGQRPTPEQLAKALSRWKQDEALSREAKREGLDRDDAQIRRRLADKVRALQAELFVPRAPSEAELDAWLKAHRSLYESPERYDLEQAYVPKTEQEARKRAETVLHALESEHTPPAATELTPSKTVLIAQLPGQLVARFGAALASRIEKLEPGAWTLAEAEDGYYALRLLRIQGGLPPRDELHARLLADVAFAARECAAAQAIEQIIARYRFEEEP
jgi:hypothetical protein